MPYLKPERPEKVSAPSLRASKQRGERLVCLTAYDYPTARIVDEAGIDIILVGDSLGNVVLGYGNTVPVTLDEILIHLKAVRRAVQRASAVGRPVPQRSGPDGRHLRACGGRPDGAGQRCRPPDDRQRARARHDPPVA